eukprot:276612-Prorocentrum_minimum.AAC.6
MEVASGIVGDVACCARTHAAAAFWTGSVSWSKQHPDDEHPDEHKIVSPAPAAMAAYSAAGAALYYHTAAVKKSQGPAQAWHRLAPGRDVDAPRPTIFIHNQRYVESLQRIITHCRFIVSSITHAPAHRVLIAGTAGRAWHIQKNIK